jgi:hypothetical protein
MSIIIAFLLGVSVGGLAASWYIRQGMKQPGP